MRGAIATAGQIEAPTVNLNTDGSLNVSATSSVDQMTLLPSIKSLFSKLEVLLLQNLALGVAPQQPRTFTPPSLSPSPPLPQAKSFGASSSPLSPDD
jgi:hypothetical protein